MKKNRTRKSIFLLAAWLFSICGAILCGGLDSIWLTDNALNTSRLLAHGLLLAADSPSPPRQIVLNQAQTNGFAWIGRLREIAAFQPGLANQPEIQAALDHGAGEAAYHREGIFSLQIVTARKAMGDSSTQANPLIVRIFLEYRNFSQHIALAALAGALAAALLTGLLFFLLKRQAGRFKSKLNKLLEKLASANQPLPPFVAVDSIADMIKSIESQWQETETAHAAKLTRALHQLESLLQMLNSMNEGVIVTDTKGRIQLMNPRARALFNLDQIEDSELLQAPLLERVRASDLFALFEAILANHNPAEMELVLYRNPICTLHVSASWIPSRDPAEQGVLFVMADISTLKHLESVRTEFVANVSHELRTPVTALKGFAETLLDGALNDPKTARHFVGIILRQTERLMAIIEDLLMLSRLEQSGGTVPLEECSLRELVDNALEICLPPAKIKNTSIKVNFSDITVSLNRHLLEQAIINLVENAIKYSPEGTEIQIDAQHISAPKAWEISVADNGPGIPLRDQERLFERFYRIEKARSRTMGGTGLGLAIVRHIALVHGGSVRIESVSGQGAKFIIQIPDFS